MIYSAILSIFYEKYDTPKKVSGDENKIKIINTNCKNITRWEQMSII